MTTILLIMALLLAVTFAMGVMRASGSRLMLANARRSKAAGAPIIAFADAERLPFDAGTNNVPGQIYLANEDRFTAGQYDVPMTEYIHSVIDMEDIERDLELIAPAVLAPKRFSFKKKGDEDFLSETDDIRAIGADFKRVTTSGSEVEAKCYNKGLTQSVDKDEVDAAMLDAEVQNVIRRLTARLFRNDLRRVVTAYSAGATNSAKTWDASADPDGDLLALIQASGDARGINPNVLITGPNALITRRASIVNPGRDFTLASADYNPEQLAASLNVDRVVSLNERYQTKPGGAKAKVFGNEVVATFIDEFTGREYDGTNLKRFYHPAEGGGRVAVHIKDMPKRIDVTVEHYSNIIVVGTSGLVKYTISSS